MSDESYLVGTIPKGQDQIQVAIKEYKGTRYCDVRLWYKPKDGGEHKPTKEGITFGLKAIKDMREFLDEAEQLAKDKGWLKNGAK